MQNINVIACDIDGTILNSDGSVSNLLYDILPILKKKNIFFTLVTARDPRSSMAVAKELGLDDKDLIVCLNGALIIDVSGKIIVSELFFYEEIKDFLLKTYYTEIVQKKLSINYYHEFKWAVSEITDYTHQEVKFMKISYEEYQENFSNQVNKICLMGDKNIIQDAFNKLSYNKDINIYKSHDTYLEILRSGVNKLSGLQHYLNINNLKLENTIAFGDQESDIPMLLHSGYGVAVSNATDDVKLIAKEVIGHGKQDGVARFLNSIF